MLSFKNIKVILQEANKSKYTNLDIVLSPSYFLKRASSTHNSSLKEIKLSCLGLATKVKLIAQIMSVLKASLALVFPIS